MLFVFVRRTLMESTQMGIPDVIQYSGVKTDGNSVQYKILRNTPKSTINKKNGINGWLVDDGVWLWDMVSNSNPDRKHRGLLTPALLAIESSTADKKHSPLCYHTWVPGSERESQRFAAPRRKGARCLAREVVKIEIYPRTKLHLLEQRRPKTVGHVLVYTTRTYYYYATTINTRTTMMCVYIYITPSVCVFLPWGIPPL